MRSVPTVWCLSLLPVMAACGTSIRLGSKEATKGAISATRDTDDPVVKDVRELTHRATRAALDQWDRGNLVESITAHATAGMIDGMASRERVLVGIVDNVSVHMGRSLARSATNEMSARLQEALGPDGNGPLARSITSTIRNVTSGATQGVTQEVTDDCPSGNPEDCLHKAVRDISRSASVGFTEGVGRKIDWLTIGLAFGGGLVAALAIAYLMAMLMRRRRLRPPRTHAPTHTETPQPA